MDCILRTDTFSAKDRASDLDIKPGWLAEAATDITGAPPFPPDPEVIHHVGYASSAGPFTAVDDPNIHSGQLFTSMDACNQGPNGCTYRARTFARELEPAFARGTLREAYDKTACTYGQTEMPSWGCRLPLALQAIVFVLSGNEGCCNRGLHVEFESIVLISINDFGAVWQGHEFPEPCLPTGIIARVTLDTVVDRLILSVGQYQGGSWDYVYNQNTCTPDDAPLGLYTIFDVGYDESGVSGQCAVGPNSYFEMNIFGCV